MCFQMLSPLWVLLIIAVLYLRFSKSKSPIRLGLLLGVVHFFMVVLLGTSISFSKDGESAMGWYYFWLTDCPSSLIYVLSGNLIDKISTGNAALRDHYIPFAQFAILGSLQYFLIGTAMSWIYNKLRTMRKRITSKRSAL